MAKSIYGFAQSVPATGSGATAAIRLYTRAVAQGTDESGRITNPDVYRIAREQFLAPLADDVRVSTKMAESLNDENRLRDAIDDVGMASSVFKSDVDDTLKQYAKQYYQDPSNLAMMTAFVYNTAVDELADEIETRRVGGQAVGDMQNLLNEYSRKADTMSRLARQTLAGSVQNPNAYGWFIKTNPDDGSIVDIALDSVDSTNRQSGYLRTDARYGAIPVWTNTVTDEDGKEVARIGSNRFEMEKDKSGSQILKKSGSQWGRFIKSLLPGGETPSEAREAARTLNIGGIQFGDVLNLPQGSVAKDASGTYYYYGGDGVYKAASKDALSRFMQQSGTPVQDVDAIAYPISRNEARSFPPFTTPDGKSRIIDDNLLGTSSPQVQSLLPPMEADVRGTFSASPTPATAMGGTTTPALPSFEVPRKDAAMKTQNQVGKKTVGDYVADAGENILMGINPLIGAGTKLFRRFF